MQDNIQPADALDYAPITDYHKNDKVIVAWGAEGFVFVEPKPGDASLCVFVEIPEDTIFGGHSEYFEPKDVRHADDENLPDAFYTHQVTDIG